MGHSLFQGGKARVVEERSQPGVETWRADAGGAIVAGAVEGDGAFQLPFGQGEIPIVEIETAPSQMWPTAAPSSFSTAMKAAWRIGASTSRGAR